VQAPGQVQGGCGEGSEGWEALVQSQATFNRVRAKVPEKVPGKLWCRANRVEGSGEGLGGCGARPSQVQQGSGEGSGAGRGSFGAEPGQVQQGSGEGSGEGVSLRLCRRARSIQKGSGEGSGEGLGGFGGRLWCRARSGSTGFRRRFRRRSGRLWCRASFGEGLGGFGAEPAEVQQGSGEGSREALVQEKVLEKVWEALVQSRVKFNRVPEKVPEKVWEALVQSQVTFNRVPENVRPLGFGAEPGQVQQGSGEGSGAGLGGFGAEVFPALGFAARIRKICN